MSPIQPQQSLENFLAVLRNLSYIVKNRDLSSGAGTGRGTGFFRNEIEENVHSPIAIGVSVLSPAAF
jgi:hypothetical protein